MRRDEKKSRLKNASADRVGVNCFDAYGWSDESCYCGLAKSTDFNEISAFQIKYVNEVYNKIYVYLCNIQISRLTEAKYTLKASLVIARKKGFANTKLHTEANARMRTMIKITEIENVKLQLNAAYIQKQTEWKN